MKKTQRPLARSGGAVALLCAIIFLYLQGHSKIHNVSLVGVLYAYNGHFTIGPCVTSAAKKNPGHDPHGIGHGHVRVYARLGHIKDTIHGSN